MDDKYFVKTVRGPTGEGTWDVLKVEVFRRDAAGEAKIGEYERNYPENYNTFHAFKQGGREYALYSSHYTATRGMSLPDCPASIRLPPRRQLDFPIPV